MGSSYNQNYNEYDRNNLGTINKCGVINENLKIVNEVKMLLSLYGR